jgi:hypothetical protein
MARVTFILGLSGAGKTWLADRMIESKAASKKFDEGFLNSAAQHDALTAALRAGQDCVVVEIAYCNETSRRHIVQELADAVPSATIEWLCIENDLAKANKNCRERTNKSRLPSKGISG